MPEVRLIGYWISDEQPQYPDPTSHIDETWAEDERDSVGLYLMSGTRLRSYMGYSTCRLCGELNGTGEFTDEVWAWPDGLAHYVLEHAVRLPAEFVQHVHSRITEIEALRPSLDWWLAHAD